MRLEALGAERDAVDAVLAEQRGEIRGDRLGVGLDRDLACAGKVREQAGERGRLGHGGRTPTEEDGLDLVRELRPLQLELGEQRVDVGGVIPVAPDDGDEVAVTAPVRAEGKVDVEVAHPRSSPRDGGAEAPFWNGTRRPVTRVHRGRADFVTTRAHLLRSSRLRTARNASCGTSTPPTCFIRFLPFFCFSSSFRFRVMSPP